MPTTEWMNRYETIKDKTGLQNRLGSLFYRKSNRNHGVDVLDIGAVHFPTGTIFACDPMVELKTRCPSSKPIPAGTYPVKICVVPQQKIRRPLCLRQGGGQRGKACPL